MDDIKVGNRYGAWTVLALSDAEHPGKVLCRCDCGTVRWLFRSPLRCGRTKSCGCHTGAQYIDYGLHAGDKVGYWTIVKQKGDHFYCRCECGTERWIQVSILLQRRSLSCGCHRQDNQDYTSAMELGHKVAAQVQREKLSTRYAGFGRKGNRNSGTGITGVSKLKNGYRAYITVDRRQIHLGCFDDLADAIEARKAAEDKYFGPRQKRADEIMAEERRKLHGNGSETKGE